MRLLLTFTAIIALSLAESEQDGYEDLVAMESMELKKTSDLKPAASTYAFPQNNNWNQPNGWNQQYVPSWNPPQNNYYPSTLPPVNNYVPPVNNYVPPANNYFPPSNNYVPPVNNYFPPSNNYVPGNPPVQSDYVPPQTGTTPHYHSSTTTTPVPVIKNEQQHWDNGAYRYEYKIGDGTHVGEEGYFSDPKGDEESLVKRGWYSYQGADGKTYTVTYWADKTGYHAYGDHLPTPPPPHPAIQASIDKENAEKNKPQTGYNPQQQPQQNYPNQQNNYPNQGNYHNQQNNQQTYYPPQQSQQTYYPPQQGYGK